MAPLAAGRHWYAPRANVFLLLLAGIPRIRGACAVARPARRSRLPAPKYLLFEAGARHGYPPGKVAGNAAVSQICGDPAARQRLHERRPPAPRAEPGVELVDQQRLEQEQVPALAQLQQCVAG